jgi:DNA-binding NtrC family response regulator
MDKVAVMLVDDEVPFVETMTKRLKRRNLDIIAAYSGEEALQNLEETKRIEVVILDVKMPGMDGVATLKEIKMNHPLIEVIMLTGHGTTDSAVEGMSLGAFDYLMKPCDIEALVSKVSEAAEKKRSHEEKVRQARKKLQELKSRVL